MTAKPASQPTLTCLHRGHRGVEIMPDDAARSFPSAPVTMAQFSFVAIVATTPK